MLIEGPPVNYYGLLLDYWCSELHKDVELKRFIAQLRKEILTGGGATSEEEGTVLFYNE